MSYLQVENILFTGVLICYNAAMAAFFLFVAVKRDRLTRIGGLLLTVGFLLHTGALAVRGFGAGRLPLSNQYEFATSFAWGICLCTLFFFYRYRFQALGIFASPILALVVGYAAMQSRDVKALMPALQSSWLGIHVSTAIISYGAFGVSCAVSAAFLLRGRLTRNPAWEKHIPSEEKLDLISYRAAAMGFLFITFVMISGAIWAERAWGSYWSWDPKETWSFITWLIYAAYLHLRLSRGWRGKKAAVFAVVGFVCVLFTYVGVNTLIPSLHSYA